MHSNRPLFSPEPSSAGEYVLVVLALLNNFHKNLREKQAQCLNKVRWGQPVIPGKHASFTIDRKHRGNPNLYDTDPNAAESDDDAEIEGTLQPKSAPCGNEDSNVVIHPKLLENEERKENFVPTHEQNVPVQIENPLKSVPSLSKSCLHSNQEESPKYKTKKLKLCKKLSNKENHKQNVKLRCLQRRNLFRKSQQESSVVLPSNHESQDVNLKQMQASLSNIPSNGIITTILPDTNMAEGQEENLSPCDPLSGSVSKESTLGKKRSSPPRTPNCENEKASPLRENNPSNLCEIRSSSPVFSANDSPFRNSEFVSHLKDISMAKTEESTGSVTSVTNTEGTSSECHLNPQSILLEIEGQEVVEVVDSQKKKSEKTKQKLMVQCPLCCDWFRPKVIEKHAANCGIIAPTKQDEQQNLVDSTSICNKKVSKDPCDLNRPSECENSKAGPTKNTESVLKTETTQNVAAVQNLNCPILMNNNSKESAHQHSTSLALEVAPVENGQSGQQTRMETESSDLIPVLKRCFICDLSYVDGKPFSTHLRACRKKYQKLKRQFSVFSEESEEPRRKTRSHSFLTDNMKNSVNSNI